MYKRFFKRVFDFCIVLLALLVQYLPLYSPEQARRHEVRPGISGWANKCNKFVSSTNKC